MSELPSFSALSHSMIVNVIHTNCIYNIRKISKYIPISYYPPIKEAKKILKIGKNLKQYKKLIGHVVSLKYEEGDKDEKVYYYKGLAISAKKPKKPMKNSISVKICVDTLKLVDIKIFKKYIWQMSGAKNMEQSIQAITFLHKILKDIELRTGEYLFKTVTKSSKVIKIEDFSNLLKIEEFHDPVVKIEEFHDPFVSVSQPDNNYFTAIIRTVNKKYDFNLGYEVDRDNLDTFFKNLPEEDINFFDKEFISIYTGIENSVKLTYKKESRDNNSLDCICIKNEIVEKKKIEFNKLVFTWTDEIIKRYDRKEKYHTFLVFRNGKLMFYTSGDESEEVYNKFCKCMEKGYRFFKKISSDV